MKIRGRVLGINDRCRQQQWLSADGDVTDGTRQAGISTEKPAMSYEYRLKHFAAFSRPFSFNAS